MMAGDVEVGIAVEDPHSVYVSDDEEADAAAPGSYCVLHLYPYTLRPLFDLIQRDAARAGNTRARKRQASDA
jgi:hypothetical protein